jgi:methyltransferase-like protein 23
VDGGTMTTIIDEQSLAESIATRELQECRVRVGEREWSVLHTDAVLSHQDERQFLSDSRANLPYGVVLWPAAIALAHEIVSRADSFRGKRVLELGAGTGLPGIIASAFGAQVVQTDRQELAMTLCKRNGERNGASGIEYRMADWASWNDDAKYDWVLGSDILYSPSFHEALCGVLTSSVAPAGRVLISDPFRAVSLGLLETLEESGWAITMSKWTIGEKEPRPIGVFEMTPPKRDLS